MQKTETRCWFCLMQASLRWLRIPVCPICRDKLYDFVWVSIVQRFVWLLGGFLSSTKFCFFWSSLWSSIVYRRPGNRGDKGLIVLERAVPKNSEHVSAVKKICLDGSEGLLFGS